MGVMVGIGAELDLATKTDLTAGLDSVVSRLSRGVDQHPVHAEPDTVYRRSVVSEAAITGTPTILNFLDQPAQGRFWSIVGLTVLGSDDHTAVAATNVVLCIGDPSAIAVGGSPPRGDVYLPGNQGGSAVGVPANVQFNRHQCIAICPQQVYLAVYGATTGQSLTALLYFWDHPLTDQGRVF